MDDYISENKAAWEEAFDNRAPCWGADLVSRVQSEDYPFFEPEMIAVLRCSDFKGKCIAQFCCNNGRELLSLVKSSGAASGTGFDIAENQIQFAASCASALNLPCRFVALNHLDIGQDFADQFDAAIITIGALCWFRELESFFKVVASCLKVGAPLIIHEQHPFTNMLLTPAEVDFDPSHPLNCVYNYFEHLWADTDGMAYITGRSYPSKTLTNFTHSISEIIASILRNGFVITGLQEFERDLSGMFQDLNHSGFPLSWIVEAVKSSS